MFSRFDCFNLTRMPCMLCATFLCVLWRDATACLPAGVPSCGARLCPLGRTDGLATEVVPSFYVTVKYLREVTPYFRKASIISEVGWELQKAFLSQRPPSPRQNAPRADTRYIPLQLCYLTRNFRHQDPGKVLVLLINILFDGFLSLLFCFEI